MKIDVQPKPVTTVTFIVPDTKEEAEQIERVARIGTKLEAVVEKSPQYMYPYIKIINEEPVS